MLLFFWFSRICGTLLDSEIGIVSVWRNESVDAEMGEGEERAYASDERTATRGTRRGRVDRAEYEVMRTIKTA